MKVYKIHFCILLSLLFSCNNQLIAQVFRCWQFDKQDYHSYPAFQNLALEHQKGLQNGQAIILKPMKKQHLELPFKPTSNQAFSISFWFYPNDVEKYVLLRQVQIEAEKPQQYIEIGIKNNEFYSTQQHKEKKELLIYQTPNNNFQALQWHYLTYTFDGNKKYQLFIDTNLVCQTELFTLSNEKREGRENKIWIGKGTQFDNYFDGAIDELCIDSMVLSQTEIARRYKQVTASLPRPKKQILILDTLKTNSQFLGFELWHEYEQSSMPSKMSIQVNEKDSLIQAFLPQKKGRKEKIMVKLKTDAENTISFSATDLLAQEKVPTAKLHIYKLDSNKNIIHNQLLAEQPYSLLYDKNIDFLFKIIHQTKQTKRHIDIEATTAKTLRLELLHNKTSDFFNKITVDDSTGSTFRILKQENIKNGIAYILELKENATNNIPLKIGFLDVVPNEKLDITFSNSENNDTLYSESLFLKNNHHIFFRIKQKKPEKPKKETPPPKSADMITHTILLGEWINAEQITLKISDKIKQRKSLLNIELDGKPIASGVSLEMARNIPLDSLKLDSYLQIIPIGELNRHSNIIVKIICKKGKGKKEDFVVPFEKNKITHIQFQ